MLGLLFATVPWVMMFGGIGGNVPRYLVLLGFWAAWFAPVSEASGFILLFAVNTVVWTLIWLVLLWIGNHIGSWCLGCIENWIGL
jgi:hypothetical protein